MKPDDKTERIKPVEDREENPSIERERESEAAEVLEPQPTGWAAQLRQIMRGSAPGEARTNIKRQQLREDRTKSFLLLAGLTVVLALAFFVMFSTPSTGRKDIARTNQPNLGRGSGGENTDTSHSVTPLLNADTRNPDDNAGNLSAQDIRNTAKQRMLAQASPSFGDAPVPPPPAPRPEPKDYALNRIQFPPEQPQTTTPIPAPKVEKLAKASLVFVSSGSGLRVTPQTSSSVQPVVLERNPEFMALPTGTRLIARLQTPVSSAVKTPVVAAIEYNYERDGEIVIPAGSKAFGELSQVNDQGYVGIQFHTIQMPDETTQKIEGHAVGLQYQPLRGQVTGRNTGKPGQRDRRQPGIPQNLAPNGTLVAPPAFLDPPQGGYRAEASCTTVEPGTNTGNAFYYSASELAGQFRPCQEGSVGIPIETANQLRFSDCPENWVNWPSKVATTFRTSLVGVLSSGIGVPLYTWFWQSNFNGTKGDVSQTTENVFPIDPNSGTGGATITNINLCFSRGAKIFSSEIDLPHS